MKLSDFDYTLPPERIAAEPAEPRDTARLLDMRGGKLADRLVADLPSCINPGDLLIVNDTKVIPARLIGKRGEATISITLHQRVSDSGWRCFAKPAKKLRLGDLIVFGENFSAKVDDIGADGERGLLFSHAGDDLERMLNIHGTMPLPPYIPRPEGVREDDSDHYQTMFASRTGAVAAPTAGLHFTPDLLGRITASGIETAQVTLHVGAGTFLPVKTDDPREHVMHKEWGEIPIETADKINRTRHNGGRIVCVGTTSLRILESCWRDHGDIRGYQAETDLYILPGYRFGVVDTLLTNFHLPKSTLLMLVSAFAGKTLIDAAYLHAMNSGYRFFSYGDACLMERQDD
jgi:S-adenosylmethionine:tRNA ribosyltransferase-isomerase